MFSIKDAKQCAGKGTYEQGMEGQITSIQTQPSSHYQSFRQLNCLTGGMTTVIVGVHKD